MYGLYILRIFKWKVAVSSVHVWNRLKQCFKHMFGRINELLIILIFEYLILLIFMKKIGFRETSPDNRGSTVQWSNTHTSVVSLSIFLENEARGRLHTNKTTSLVKSLCETVPKSLFLASTSVPGFESVPWLVLISQSSWRVIRYALLITRCVYLGTRISALLRSHYSLGLGYQGSISKF